MPKYGDDLLLLCHGLQANGAQIFWDTPYDINIGFQHCNWGMGGGGSQLKVSSKSGVSDEFCLVF